MVHMSYDDAAVNAAAVTTSANELLVRMMLNEIEKLLLRYLVVANFELRCSASLNLR